MEFLPISLNVTGKRILIVGGGHVALQKVKSLIRFDVSVTVIGIRIEPELAAIENITIIKKSYDPSDLEGYFMAYACTDNKHTNEIIRDQCHERNILVSVADTPKLCDFVSPAIYKDGDLTVAVGSNARNARKSVRIRDHIKRDLESSSENADGTLSNNKGYDRRKHSPRNLHQEIFDKKGTVVLAGFGPGDPGLLTLKANQYLQEADVVFHDALLDVAYLDRFPAEKVSVGKRCGQQHKNQDEINELLLEAALAGKNVVRLKGGDPLVFGRGGEEISFLNSHNIDVEIIPGITSAFAASAQYGLALTQRDVSSSVVFCVGHDLNRRPLPTADTLVFYMGASHQCEISKALMEEGWSKDTPVALMSNISNTASKAVISQLDKLCSDKLMIETPLLIIVGETVRSMR